MNTAVSFAVNSIAHRSSSSSSSSSPLSNPLLQNLSLLLRQLQSTMEWQPTFLTFPSSSKPPTLSTLEPNPNPNPNLNPFFNRSRTNNIRSAISRTKKEEAVENFKTHLDNCSFLVAIKCQGFNVKQFQELRQSLPENTKLLVAKNTLVYKAIERTKWEQALKPNCMKGMNAWLFVNNEETGMQVAESCRTQSVIGIEMRVN
ncbi:hypothetical protein LWI28_026431 [Acer negundo]|uniref:Ribosomal protein L10 n=1 Tax=Acer negundo TaxID=4023 RepID=A0AAD5NHJ3_ACENE|nr:hypothetical protein LWI28_026431 [Acer negundo]KAK4835924.1 hypothetical protein QYF36_016411 [Acer negundo]